MTWVSQIEEEEGVEEVGVEEEEEGVGEGGREGRHGLLPPTAPPLKTHPHRTLRIESRTGTGTGTGTGTRTVEEIVEGIGTERGKIGRKREMKKRGPGMTVQL